MTEQELRFAVRCSRKEGYRLVYQQYYPYVYSIVWEQIRTVGTKEDAEECVSDVLTELFIHFEEAEEGSLQSFVGTLARRRAVDLFRRLVRHDPPVSIEEEAVGEIVSADSTEGDVETNLRQKALFRHIQSLGEPDAAIVMLKYFYDCNSAEIGKKLCMNPITVRTRLKRALKKLKKILLQDSQFTDGGEP